METMEKTKLAVRTTVQAPIDRVWTYWNEAPHVTRWNHASDNWHCPSAKNDLRVSGKFNYRMEAKDGSFGFDFGGTYDEIKPKELIVYTMGDGRRVTVRFQSLQDATRIEETFESENVNSLEKQQSGWQAILDNFKNYAESKLSNTAEHTHSEPQASKLGICLWFNMNAEEAVNYYLSVFKDSKKGKTAYYGEGAPVPAGKVVTIEFQLNGQEFLALNGGPNFTFNEAVSFIVKCENQPEIDYYWEALCQGGKPSQCGWLKDKFGVSWQIVPKDIASLLGGPDKEGAARAFKAMMGMVKLDINVLKRAYEGK